MYISNAMILKNTLGFDDRKVNGYPTVTMGVTMASVRTSGAASSH